jgi:hypothetical protein
MKGIMAITFIVSFFFGLIASLMAFLITYQEFTHHYPDKGKPFRLAMQAAIFAFVFFLAVTIVAVLLLSPIL